MDSSFGAECGMQRIGDIGMVGLLPLRPTKCIRLSRPDSNVKAIGFLPIENHSWIMASESSILGVPVGEHLPKEGNAEQPIGDAGHTIDPDGGAGFQ